MQAFRRALELGLVPSDDEPWKVLPMSEVFAGPSAPELVKAAEALEPPTPPRAGARWWDEEMAENWPKEYRRRNPGWGGGRR